MNTFKHYMTYQDLNDAFTLNISNPSDKAYWESAGSTPIERAATWFNNPDNKDPRLKDVIPPASPMNASGASYIQSPSTAISKIQEGQAQSLSDITELQNIEKEYFDQLNQGLTNNSLSSGEKDQLVQKINEISQMRINLYKNLNGVLGMYQSNISSTQDTMTEQSAAIDIVENELNEAKRRLAMIEEEKYNKLRLVEINNYYGERYSDHTSIMKIIIAICLPILIFSVLANRGLIPHSVYILLMFIIVIIGMIVLGRHLYYTYLRDNMNYQEFDWKFNKAGAPSIDTDVVAKDPWESLKRGICVGQDCCDAGYTYNSDPDVNKCVPTTSSSLGSSPV